LQKENVGFCKGNNLGYSQVDQKTEFVLFLNPDAFLPPVFMQEALGIMESHPSLGALSSVLLGYDPFRKEATGRVDSTGIFRTWYGKWYDRDHGAKWTGTQAECLEAVPALCGALMLCRQKAVQSVLIGQHEVMDERYFMYKEDIDLSLRLRQKGWEVAIAPQLIAYHCRGWNKKRSCVPKSLRLMSARNEMRLYARLKSPCILYSAIKYMAVKWLNV
jgi:GT2 family glycosyltransferase